MDVIAKDSSKTFINQKYIIKTIIKILESFLLSWGKQKSLTLIILISFDTNEENLMIIEKYKKSRAYVKA